MLLLACLCSPPAQAEFDAQDYKLEHVIPPGAAREQARAQIARESEQAALRAREEAEQAARQRAQAAAEEARRPYPERLLRARCSACHPLDVVLYPRHGRLGWQVVILRMRLFNRAPLDLAEQPVLAGELVRLRPAPLTVVVMEFAAAVLLMGAPLVLAWALWRRRSRR